MAATIDEVSGGRFVLGLGAGWNEREFRAFGIPYDHRVARFEESFAIVRGLLAGERVTLAGRFWQADDAVLLPPPARRAPLMIGSNGPRMLGIALPHVDAWNTWWDDYGNSAEGFAALQRAHQRRRARRPAARRTEIERSACVLVVARRRDAASAAPRPARRRSRGRRSGSPRALRELADAGADEAILVADPITERSIRELAEVVALAAARPARPGRGSA